MLTRFSAPLGLLLGALFLALPKGATAANCAGGIAFYGATTCTSVNASFSFQHDSGAGANRLLLVQVISREIKIHEAVSVAGLPLTPILDLAGDTPVQRRMSLWWRANPPAGVSTIQSQIDSGGDHVVLAVTYNGVNQSQPYSDWTGVSGTGANAVSISPFTFLDNHVAAAFSTMSSTLANASYSGGGVDRVNTDYAGLGNYSFSEHEYAEAAQGSKSYSATYGSSNWAALASLELVPAGCTPPTWTYTPSPSSSPTPSSTASPSASPTFTLTPSGSPSASPSATPTPSATSSANPTRSATPTGTPTSTRSATPSASPTRSASPSPTFSATSSSTLTASSSPTRSATATGSPTRSATATLSPSFTASPVYSPTCTPSPNGVPLAGQQPGQPAFQPLFPSRPPWDKVCFGLPASPDSTLRIFDMSQRQRLERVFSAQAPCFDGRDSSGQALPSGHYYYWIEQAGREFRGHLTVAR